MSDLKDISNSHQPACVALQETHLKPENSFRLHGYTVFRKDHPANRASGGVALLISNNIPSSLLTLNTSFQAIAAQIFTHKLITVCSLYLPPNTHIDKTNLNNLVLQLPEPFVILGDLNGHSQIWGSDDTNSRGRQIEKLLHDHNLCLLNTHEITHFHTPTRTFHCIDLAICSPSLLPFFSLQTDPDLHNSDHFPIILTDNRHSHLHTVFSRFKYDLANWTKFTSTACITKTMQLFLYHRSRYSSFIPIFTDGSKSDGHVGCGVVFSSDTLSYRLHNCCSVFTAEIVAIFCAIQKISLSPQREFIVYTDSISALETLSHYHSRMHPTAIRILFTLRLLQNGGYNILFCWVPSHVGITGNETADYAAKSSSSFLIQGLPYSDIKKHFSCRIFSSWQGTWDLQIHNKQHSIKLTVCLWPILSIREVDVKLTRLRIGHTRFTHRHLIFGERIPICPTCRVGFTVRHILVECPGFNSHRVKFFQSSSITMQDLVGEIHHPNIFNFLKAIGLYTCI
ncbi:hypothetical protein AVEN_233521-1 [Araneus ventricosus]|uniref:RNase H type-1 domain-containing protein n=1 Tax=Araneus ventricosus TaxID=182803 RepID=A0A4Y2NDR6_ARAVE|nr:hypothetical protein AVEN_233521-1 [Araneus ventricosus]